MIAKLGRIFVAVAVLLIGGASLYTMWANNKANKIKDEGNAAIQSANQFLIEANAKLESLLSEPNQKAFPGNRKELEAPARETGELLTKVAAGYRRAKSSFEDAAKNIKEKHVVDYWSLKADECEKRAQVQEARREIALLVLDPKLESWDQFNLAGEKIVEQLKAAEAAAEKAAADAEKIQTDYPNSISK